jgi:ATP-binding cassette subfamily B protein
VFSGTVAEAIAFGRPARREQIVRAAELANADGFIAALPGGYDSRIEERGSNFSGGQLQRLAIARAVLGDPAVLLLDEATSALDNRTENEVIEALEVVGRRCTTVVIAHRLSTVMRCDRIYEFEAGTIKASGTFEELQQRSETFRDLASLERKLVS